MVKHIVMFKLKETLSAEEKMNVMTQFKAAIEALPATINVIRKVFVGLNINGAETWDICLESEFDTLEDVKGSKAYIEYYRLLEMVEKLQKDLHKYYKLTTF